MSASYRTYSSLEYQRLLLWAAAGLPNGYFALSDYQGGFTTVWNPKTGQLTNTLMTGLVNYKNSLLALPNGNLVVGAINCLKYCNLSTNICNNMIDPNEGCIESYDKIMTLTKNELVVVSFRRKYLMAWNTKDYKFAWKTSDICDGSIECVVTLSDGNIATCGSDGKIQILFPSDGTIKKTLVHNSDIGVHSAVEIKYGFLATGANWPDNTVKIWNYLSGLLVKTLIGHQSTIHAMVVTKDLKLATVEGEDSNIFLWT